MTESKKKTSKYNSVHEAINAFQAENIVIDKDAENPYYKSKYATLDNIIETIADELTGHELCVTSTKNIMVDNVTQVTENIEGTKGKTQIKKVILGHLLTTTITHFPSDTYIEDISFLPLDEPQKEGSDITYNRRYALSSMLNLSVDSDDDANATKKEKDKPKTAKKQSTAPSPRPTANKVATPPVTESTKKEETISFEGIRMELMSCDNADDLKKVWTTIVHNESHFSSEDYADLERTKDNKKTMLGIE